MHPIGSRECWSLYGGPRQHFRLWWTYKCEWTPEKMWHRWLCYHGHHNWTGGYHVNIMGRERYIQRACGWCFTKPPEEVA